MSGFGKDFAGWLEQQLNSRGWSQMDLVNSARAQGYKLTSSQISRILNREQEGGIGAVTAIAHGLGLPRELVFRERGWLLNNAPTPSALDPEAAHIAEKLSQLPIEARQAASKAVLGVIDSFWEVVGKKPSFDI